MAENLLGLFSRAPESVKSMAASAAQIAEQNPEALAAMDMLSMLPGGGQAAAAGGGLLGLAKTINRADLTDLPNTPDLRATPPTVQKANKINNAGDISGAPRGVNSPSKLRTMRQRLEKLLVEGTPGWDWYDQSTQAVIDNLGNQQNARMLGASTNAIYSQGTSVPANRTMSATGFNQAVMERPITAGRFPASQGPKVEMAYQGIPFEPGPKVLPFFEGNTIDMRQGVRPTNDLWAARAFNYTDTNGEPWSQGLGQAQHRFMDKEMARLVNWANNNKIGGKEDWSAEQAQAAVWVAIKAQDEGISVQDAAKNFSSDLDDMRVSIRYEAAPSESLTHLPGVSAGPDYMEAVNEVLTNPTGRDLLSLSVPAMTLPSTQSAGFYGGQVSPSMNLGILGGPTPKTVTLDPAAQDMSRLISSGRGLTLGQETVGTTYLRKPAGDSERNAMRVNMGRNPTPDEVAAKQRQLDETFDGNVLALASPYGFDVIYAGDPASLPGNFARSVRAAFKDEKSSGATIDLMTNSGQLYGNLGFDGYRPSQWMREIDSSNAPAGVMQRFENMVRDEARALSTLDSQISATVAEAGAVDPVLMRARDILCCR
jgi:hypothetical protein